VIKVYIFLLRSKNPIEVKMAIIPIQIEGQKQPNRFSAVDCRGSFDRRGSLARIGAADPLTRRGSYARILADVSNRRRGSAAKINPGLIGGNNAAINSGDRRDSYAQISIDLGRRRGSLLRRESKQDIKRKISLSKAGGDDPAAGSRRGSIVNGGGVLAGGRRGSDARFDSLLARRGSGQVGRAMSRRGSRPQIKSFNVKIRLEDDDKDKVKGINKDKENKTTAKSTRGIENKSPKMNNNKMAVKKKETKEITPVNKPVSPRWQDVDREVLQYRGAGERAGIEVQPVQTRNRISPTPASKKKAESSAPVCSPEFLAQFAQEALDQHNKYRTIHGVKPLTLDSKLNAHAQKYAQHLAKTSTFEHSDDPDYGENLYWSWSSDPNFKVKGHESVDSWYEECLQCYNYNKEPTDTESGHFTQLVWDTTTKLGVGLAKSSTGRNTVVMKYDPPGNYVGLYTKHVHKPVSCTTPAAQ